MSSRCQIRRFGLVKSEPKLFIGIEDVRKAGHCSSGARRWCEVHDIDFRDFLRYGMAADEFVAKGDGLAFRVVIKTFARLLRETGERLEQKQTQS